MRSRVFFLLLFFPFFAGCANYQLGTAGKLSFSSLYVAPVKNKTLLPQAVAIVSTQLRDEFIRDNRITLTEGKNGADATLETTINVFKREVSTNLTNDTGLARSFTATLGVICTLRDNRTGKILFQDRAISVQREVYTDSGLIQAEYQMLPVMAEALAPKIMHSVVDVW